MIPPVKTAMVLAAGRGERLRPLTDTLPKPLVTIAGRTLLDHALDRLAAAGVETVVVNTHYRGQQIIDHLAGRTQPRILISPEASALETGGGVQHALPLLGDAPIFVVNGDSLWRDAPASPGALARLAQAFDPQQMEGMLLLQPTETAIGYDDGVGDFSLDAQNRPIRRREGEIVPYLYAGVQLMTPALFDGVAAGRFSNNLVWNRALAAGRLGAILHQGGWYHVSTPDGRDRVERHFHGD